ncbi:hypothetical protein E4U22_004550, partial [Claviceps purpurea]
MDFLIHIGIPKDPMDIDPRTILATMVHLDNKVILGMMAPLDHMAVDIMATLDHLNISETLLPPMALNHNTSANLTTPKHVKAVLTLNMKTEGSNVAKTRSSKRIRKKTNTQATQKNSSCLRARATPDDWAELLSVMLAGKALTWYMNTLEGRNLSFDDAVMAIHRTFETRSNYQGHFDRFSTMTIHMVIEKNPDKSLRENFDILVTDLETLFYGTHHPSLIDITLLGRLRQAVTGIPEFKQAIYAIETTPTYEGFLNNLRNALDAEQTSNPARQFNTSATPVHHPTTPLTYHDEAMFTDRRYGRANQASKATTGRSKTQFQRKCF